MNAESTSLSAGLRSLPRSVWILFAGTFLNKFGSFVIPFLTLYMTGQGYSIGQAGFAISAYGVGHIIASALGGYLSDHIGRRNTIVLSMFSAAVTMMMLSQARGLPAIVILTGLCGLTAEMYRPASSALLADLIPPGQRVTAFAAYRMAFNAGWAFGPATAGFLANHSFFWLFAGDALTSALFGLVAWTCLPHGLRARGSRGARWSDAFRVIRHDRRFLLVLASSLCIGLVFLQMSSTFGMHITAHGFSPATYGALISLNGVLVVLFELPLTTITRRFAAPRIMALGYLLIGTGFAFNAWATQLGPLIAVVTMFTFGEMIAMPVASAYVADITPPDLRGRYMGSLGFVWALALVIGPNLGLRFYATNPVAMWIGCGVLGLLAANFARLNGRADAAAPMNAIQPRTAS